MRGLVWRCLRTGAYGRAPLRRRSRSGICPASLGASLGFGFSSQDLPNSGTGRRVEERRRSCSPRPMPGDENCAFASFTHWVISPGRPIMRSGRRWRCMLWIGGLSYLLRCCSDRSLCGDPMDCGDPIDVHATFGSLVPELLAVHHSERRTRGQPSCESLCAPASSHASANRDGGGSRWKRAFGEAVREARSIRTTRLPGPWLRPTKS